MLKQTTIDYFKTLGFDVDKLTAAIKAPGEVDYEVPQGTFFSEEALAQRDTNLTKEAESKGEKIGFKTGKDAGLEIAGKAILKKFNLDPATTNPLDPDKIVEAINKNVAKGDEGLTEQIKLLQKDKESLLGEKERLIKEGSQAKFDAQLITNFPQKRSGAIMSDEEYLLTTKANLQFEVVDNVMVVKKGTEIMRDNTTKAPLPLKDALNTYFAERKWLEAEQQNQGGRGGNDGLPGDKGKTGIRNFKQAKEVYLADNPKGNVASAEFQAYVGKIAKEVGPEFDFFVE